MNGRIRIIFVIHVGRRGSIVNVFVIKSWWNDVHITATLNRGFVVILVHSIAPHRVFVNLGMRDGRRPLWVEFINVRDKGLYTAML